MCTEKYHGDQEKAKSLLMLRLFIKKLQKGLSFFVAARRQSEVVPTTTSTSSTNVPDDVKEGHFALFAAKGGERKRFVVKLELLNSPAFVRLLEKAEEEYGFSQTGTLVVPCKPEELQKILSMNSEGY